MPGTPAAAPRSRSPRSPAALGPEYIRCAGGDAPLPATSQVHPGQNHGGAGHLLETEALAEDKDAGDDPDEGHEVLVDEHAVCPHVGDAPLPGGETEGRGEERG